MPSMTEGMPSLSKMVSQDDNDAASSDAGNAAAATANIEQDDSNNNTNQNNSNTNQNNNDSNNSSNNGDGDDDDNGDDDNGDDDDDDGDTSNNTSNSNESEEEEESSEEYIDDEDDPDDDAFNLNRLPPRTLGNSTARKNKARHERSLIFANLRSPDLYVQPKVAKEKTATSDEIAIWRNEAVIAMARDSQASDLLTCYMLMGRGGAKMTPWQSEMSMFFMVAFVIGVTPYQLILGQGNATAATLPLQRLVDGDRGGSWRLPKIPNLTQHLRIVLKEIYKRLQSKWNETKDRIENHYTVDDKKTVTLPDCPSESRFTSLVYKGRNLMWKIWWSHPECCKRDVRAEVVDWASRTLMHVKRPGEFKSKIESYWSEGLAAHKLEHEKAYPSTPMAQGTQPEDSNNEDGDKDDNEQQDDDTQHQPEEQQPEDEEKEKDDEQPDDKDGEGKDDENPFSGEEDSSDSDDEAPLSALKERMEKKRRDRKARMQRKASIKARLEKRKRKAAAEDAAAEDAAAEDAAAEDANKKKSKNNNGQTTSKGNNGQKLPTKSAAFPKPSDIAAQMQLDIDQEDPVLGIFVREWYEAMKLEADPNSHLKLEVAVFGIKRESVKAIWLAYHSNGADAYDLEAPRRSHRGSTVYLEPSTDFKCMAKDVMRVMNTLLLDCDSRGLRIIRLYWEYHLMKGINQLKLEDLDPQLRMRAMYSCLVLSAATTDFDAINGAIKLYQCGLLDTVDALADAPLEKIITCIRECGIHNKRALMLKQGFQKIREEHSGMIPQKLSTLISLPGVGRKTATLLLNEGYGFFAGIGTDKHVCNVAFALGLFSRTFGLKNSAPEHVENSLRSWISQPHFKETNRIFGSIAQLVTQQLSNPKSNNFKDELGLMVQCIRERFNSNYELELIWHIIYTVRKHYKVVVEKRIIAQKNDQEESGDEGSDDEEEAEEISTK
jgi:endonuclease III